MKSFAKKILAVFGVPFDLLLAIFAAPAALILLAYRRTGSKRLPITTGLLRAIGVSPIRRHYYEPLFDTQTLTRPLSEVRSLPGIDFNFPAQLQFLTTLTYAHELVAMRLDQPSPDPGAYFIRNGSFEAGDADFLYQFLRATRPSRVIEIGSGFSSKIARLALLRNAAEDAQASPGQTPPKPVHICIEPYEMEWLETLPEITVLRKLLQEVDLDWSRELGPGDLLFVDSSHMIRPQGDVLKEYLEIFPRLASGVYIHIHDIFSPRDYPHLWVVDEIRFWNEQYLLEALLTDSSRYEVIASVNHLCHEHYDRLQAVCPYLTPDRPPGSFYLRVR